MNKKAIIHLMTKSRMKSEVFSADIDAMEEISEKHPIKNVIFYKWEKIEYVDLMSKLEKLWIILHNYSNRDDLKQKVLDFSKEYEILYVNTALELLINSTNTLKKALWQKTTQNTKIFRNKYLQREIIQNHNSNLWVKFLKWTIENLDISDIEKTLGYPFIIKPIDWVQSSWVAKIKNKKDFEKYVKTYKDFHDRLEARGIDNKELLLEEFIDWTLYSIDYFVNQEWEIFSSKPVKQRLLSDIKIDDYWVLARISSKKTEGEFKWKKLLSFISDTVKATSIRNTYVHHEFKINSKWELKTIELNGRIGWWRLELLKKSYWLNIYELILWENYKSSKLKESNIVVNIYATSRWILKDFNHKLLEKIKNRDSVYSIETDYSAVWKEIGPTKDGFIKIWAIKLSNKNYNYLASDFDFIKKHYSKLLIIDEFDENMKIKKKNIFKLFREYFNT